MNTDIRNGTNTDTNTGGRRQLSITLVICSIAAGIAVVGLGLPASWITGETRAASPALGESNADNGYAYPSNDPAAAGAAINIEGFAFQGSTVAQANQVITVTNSDGVAHTLTDVGGAFDSGTIGGGSSTTVAAPAVPGTYQFFCTLHPTMTSSITVRP